MLGSVGNTKHRPTQKHVPLRVGETTSLTIPQEKGEKVNRHTAHTAEVTRIVAGHRGCGGDQPVGPPSAVQPIGSTAVARDRVTTVTTSSIRSSARSKRTSLRPTSEPSSLSARTTQ